MVSQSGPAFKSQVSAGHRKRPLVKCGEYGLALLGADEQTSPLVGPDDAEWLFIRGGGSHRCLICHFALS